MFFNAMKKKGWNPDERDMSTVVKVIAGCPGYESKTAGPQSSVSTAMCSGMCPQIHNAVNERAWSEVLRWESMHSGSCT